jgi:hypothetical protein
MLKYAIGKNFTRPDLHAPAQEFILYRAGGDATGFQTEFKYFNLFKEGVLWKNWTSSGI